MLSIFLTKQKNRTPEDALHLLNSVYIFDSPPINAASTKVYIHNSPKDSELTLNAWLVIL